MSLIEQALKKQQAQLKDSEHQGKVQSVNENTRTTDGKAVLSTTQSHTSTAPTKQQIFVNEALLSQKNFIVGNELEGQRALKEEFRQIKRKVLNNAFGPARKTLDTPNMVMITSAKPNEGKTFVSINLALSIALEQDKTVLLVDADVLKPSILRELGVKPKAGLIDYLTGDIDDIGEIIYRTNINKLSIMPAGKSHHLANELLASERMAKMTKELSQRYADRIVIFDSPPLLGINETSILSNLMGQALITVEENQTNLNDVKHANHLLRAELAKGLVLNKALYSHKNSYGYYGYGYGYGEHQEDE
ncbi:XrtA-associated tyrosine autokinase [Thalassotalea ponticola]|uniref:XrtA-associated tyrosine autokinase n=1 Tax=Thalassotalea ponticola TaxID=1523392 RepID=UPI0025B5143A|nr:XrtA-associated tyrosine autokinase [Thalassotalea ponticola]MDN3652432.1 XrtA-associated tyrosine autokinase [Thalassotalea ponticola]